MIDECLVQRDRSMVIIYEGSSSHDLSLDCVKLRYLDTLNQMSEMGPIINPHVPMFLDTFKDVVLILLNFQVTLKLNRLRSP